jgi:hypothetical protein
MQKLTRISSVKNNKSCRIIHHESTKINLAFFWFFDDFIRIFKVPAITQTLFKNPLLLQPPWKLSFLTDKPLVRRFPLRKNWRLAIGSPGARPTEVRRNSSDAPLESGRGGRGGDLGTTEARFCWVDWGTGWPVEVGAPSASGAGRRAGKFRRGNLRQWLFGGRGAAV